jgi:superfamily I DNA and/or RNA helicase
MKFFPTDVSDVRIDDDEAKMFGISDRELIKHLFKKVILLEETVYELEHQLRIHEEWIKLREKN